jgi:hypothetical protein
MGGQNRNIGGAIKHHSTSPARSMTEKKTLAAQSATRAERANPARERSKKIGSSLRLMRQARDGVMTGGNPFARRLSGENTGTRNQRILKRFLELLRMSDGNARGLATQLEREFKISRQYISREIIKPYTEPTTAMRRK